MTNTSETQTWNVAVLNIDWRADRHEESHCIEFERPTKENPRPQYPVVVGKALSDRRLPMSDSWRHLFSTVVVEAFDEHSLTVQYGAHKYVIRPDRPWVKLGESGMNYTTFWLYIGVKYVEPKPVMQPSLKITHDEAFLRRFRTKERVLHITNDEAQQLHELGKQGDAYAQYGYGRWLYYHNPKDEAMSEAEELFFTASWSLSEAQAAYAQMLRYGETTVHHPASMDINESVRLAEQAAANGSILAATLLARHRMFGNHCEAVPQLVANEIEQRLASDPDGDPIWHTLLGHAYIELEKRDEAISQYEQALALGELDAYYFLATTYQQRGNMALSDSYMEEGCSKGVAFCMIYRANTKDEDYDALTKEEQQQLHRDIDERLHRGMEMGEGTCAFYLWLHNYYGGLGYKEDKAKAMPYLQRGIQLADISSMELMAQMADDDELPAGMTLTPAERGELWLRAARNSPHDEDALRGLRRVSSPLFLLRHKEELERYWEPLFAKLADEEEREDDDGRWDAWT